MELSQFTDYSLRALIYVGLRGDDLCSVKDVSEAFCISRNHMVKVVHNLGKRGYLETRRGRGGGIRLKASPDQVRIGDLISELESMALVECIPPKKGTCCIIGVCELQAALGQAKQAFVDELNKFTLADLIRRKTVLRRRLGLSKSPPAISVAT
jgi:Rrf2 family transcriptional regulator, nitric oxide-sensitive transcriptional repressor